MRKVIRRSAGAGLLALAGAALAAPPASADTEAHAYHMGQGNISYSAGDGSNDASITAGDTAAEVVIDDVVPITVGEGCLHPDAADTTRVICTIPPDSQHQSVLMNVVLGGGNDVLMLRAGSGNWVRGGTGDDELDVNAGTNSVHADEGDDLVVGDVSYITGGDGDDHVIAGDRNGYLSGGDGNDYLVAGHGADVVFGNSGEDTVRGGTGDDEIYGGTESDVLYGNSGDDLLIGGAGTDGLSGGPGDDTLVQG